MAACLRLACPRALRHAHVHWVVHALMHCVMHALASDDLMLGWPSCTALARTRLLLSPTRLFHPADAPFLSPAGERNTACIYSRVDVSRAAAASRQHGAFARAQPHVATVRRGDLLYLPLGWWHAVRGSQERNISVNFWFELHPSKRDAACPEEGGAAAA